jgi:ABC-type Zn uptake system ZnuABC Zn-binding protein ZnuA
MPFRLTARRVAALLGAALLVTACGGGDGAATGGAPHALRVVATTTQAADLVRQVGGSAVDVTQILAPNADPHEYEVRPGDVKALVDAQLVVASGGDVDAWLGDAIAAAGTKAPTLTLIDHVHRRRRGGELDPHWWQDPRNAVLAVAALRDALDHADPAGRARIDRGAAAYTARLRALDASVAACMDRVPAAERRLVTTHDALGYYADRYGIRVVGAVIPSLSTNGQASAGELADLVATIRREHVSAVFAESSVNAKVERAIARESGARIGAPLWADTLGPSGSSGATYVGSIIANTRALVDGFTGGATTCRLPT